MLQALRYVTLFDVNNLTSPTVNCMVQFTDPLTDTNYNPIGDPVGTAKQSVYAIAGISMTLLLLSIANTNVVPRVQSALSSLTGANVGEGGFTVGSNGGGL